MSFPMLNKMKLNIPFSVVFKVTRRLMKRFFWFSLPIAAVYVLIQFSGILFAPTMWTARILEAASSNQNQDRSPFIPNKRFEMLEYGDKEFYDDNAHRRHNVWLTDKYGFRNSPDVADTSQFDIVITGASNVYGSFLSQDELISSRLSELCQCSVYNYGKPGLRSIMFSEQRFITNPPKIFIIVVRRGEFFDDRNKWMLPSCSMQGAGNYICVPEAPKAPSKFEVFVGQMKKAPLFHFIRARLGAGSLPETKILDEEKQHRKR